MQFQLHGGVILVGLAFGGHELIGAVICVIAFVVRLRANANGTAEESQTQIDAALVLLFISVALSIVGVKMIARRHGVETWLLLPITGMFMITPASAILAIKGRGAGRKVLLYGYGAMVVWAVLSAPFAAIL